MSLIDYNGTTIEDLKASGFKAFDYIKSVDEKYKEIFLENYNQGTLNEAMAKKICSLAEDSLKNGLVVIYSADYCSDCQKHVPTMVLLAQMCKHLKIIVRPLKRNSKTKKWEQLPPEFNSLNIKKIPTIIVFNGNGKELGRIVEKPPKNSSIEKELLDILNKAS